MKLTFKQKAAFGIGAVGKDMVYALSSSYIMYYYQDIIKESTLKFHNHNMLGKLGVSSRKEMLRYAALINWDMPASPSVQGNPHPLHSRQKGNQ